MRRIIAGLLAGGFVSLSIAQDDVVVITATRFADSRRDLRVGCCRGSSGAPRNSAESFDSRPHARFCPDHSEKERRPLPSQEDMSGSLLKG